jgi:hypothetical protein
MPKIVCRHLKNAYSEELLETYFAFISNGYYVDMIGLRV